MGWFGRKNEKPKEEKPKEVTPPPAGASASAPAPPSPAPPAAGAADGFIEVTQPGGGDEFTSVEEFSEEKTAPAGGSASGISGVPGQPSPSTGASLPPTSEVAKPPLFTGVQPDKSFTMAASTPALSSSTGYERLDSVERNLNEVVNRLNTLDKFTENVKIEIDKVHDSIQNLEGTMRELTSLYDLISSQVNPFIDSELASGAGEKTESPLPAFESLFEVEKPPEPETPKEEEPVFPEEGPVEEVPLKTIEAEKPKRIVRLTEVGTDPLCWVALFRWIEFMLERVSREQMPTLLTYYVRIGWISENIKRLVLDKLKGIKPTSREVIAGTMDAHRAQSGDVVMAYQKDTLPKDEKAASAPAAEDDWRLSIEDHLKSLMFIEKIRGAEINKTELDEFEKDVTNLKKGLGGFFGL